MASERKEKPFYKKWWVWLLALLFIFALPAFFDEGDRDKALENENLNHDKQLDQLTADSAQNENTTTPDAPPENEEKKSTPPAEEKGKEKITKGTYKVGTDIPVGEYLVFAKGFAYIESASDSTGQLDSILFNENLSNGAHTYVTLHEGEYFKLQDAEMYPISSAPSVIPEDGIYDNGMFKVGQDIPAGEYKVILDSSIGMGYLEVSSDSSHQLTSVVTNENVQADMYITVSDGQYLTLQDVKIQK
ncbi:hypothetical protein [Bacillus tuaregi]|uniref:hypothetical protein n=1 Tax=Bacillus tuaregi TaxID=1816695 RepID=UPI0008F83183|nr:hypothetical protein [Bacillus tuaregi]